MRQLALLLSLFLPAGFAALPAAAEEKLPINVILPLTGGGAFLGKQQQVALGIAEKLVNASGGVRGRPIEIVFHDDATSPQTDIQLASQIVAAKPAIILGPSLKAGCGAVLPLMHDGPVDYCVSPTLHPDSGSFVFTASVENYDLDSAMVRFLRLKGWTRLALVTSTDAQGQDAVIGFADALRQDENRDMKLVVHASFNPTDVSVAAQIENVKAKQPQAILAWSTGAQVATVFKALVQAGIDLPVATNAGNMIYQQMVDYAAFLPKQIYFPITPFPPHPKSVKLDPAVDAALAAFHAAFAAEHLVPDAAATFVWDPFMIVVAALRQLGPEATAPQLRDYIGHLTNYAGINGLYDFAKVPQRGLSEDDVIVASWSAERKDFEVSSNLRGIPLEK